MSWRLISEEEARKASASLAHLREVAAQTDKPYGLILAEIRAELGLGEPQ